MPYEVYFKEASEGLIIVDRAGLIIEANARTEHLFGYAHTELVGQPIEILLPEQLRQLHRLHRVGYFAAPRSRSMGVGMNLVGRRKDGSEFPVEVSLTYAQGTSRGDLVVAAIIDITQRLALEHEARRVETFAALGTLAAGIAHDLNNPLQIILSRTELLLATPVEALAPDTREDLVVLHRHAERASRIVNEFVQLSRHYKKANTSVDISRVVSDTLLLMAEQLRKAGINIRTIIDSHLPLVTGDATALERVLVNLLTNAREVVSEGGAVTIEASRMSDRPDWLRLTVEDTGPGIPPEALNRIFDLLYSTKSEGSGLGLWLSRRIILEHNGKIEVESIPGEGTVFTIMLHAADS
jgi:two-component system, LuxR family, sensor kinase FixL